MLYVIYAMLMHNSAPGAVPADELAFAIYAESKAQDVDAVLIAKVLLVESRGRADAVNKASDDYGLMQIHGATARSMGVTNKCLRNWRCNLRTGVTILAAARRPCHYNTGPVVTRYKMPLCLRYEHKLANMN